MLELLNLTFFQNAILGSVLVSVVCGLIGVLIMINRLFSIAGGITHAAFGGIGIAVFFSASILLSTSVFTVVLALVVAFLSKRYQHRSDSIIAVIWSFGMALGVILLDLSPAYNSDLMSYLFGNILALSDSDLYLALGVSLLVVFLIILFYRQFEILSFDLEFARTKGLNTSFFYYLLIVLIALVVVISMRLVGLILVLALLSIPSFIVESYTKKLGLMMLLSVFLSVVFCLSGLLFSVYFNLSSGACIIAVACFGFLIHLLVQVFKR